MNVRIRLPQRPPLASGALLALAAVVLSACSDADPGNTLLPAGPASRMEDDLYTLIYYVAIAVFVVVEALLLWTTWRFRHRRDQAGLPVQTHGNTVLELGWTIAPTLILLLIAIPTVSTIAN